ncbi:MAG TPA: tetratricopeptide repeat protein [Candidatus Angelobacter sp.]|nr:tetratricopeptide repeat protein [Candidatus Angelobacter sp.]
MKASRRLFFLIALFLLVMAGTLPLEAQRTGGTSGSSGGGRGTPTTNLPPFGNTNTQPTGVDRQPIYIWGKVLLENGGPPPEPVPVERVCGGSAHREGYTDSKGEFSFQLGQNYEIQDATQNDTSGLRMGRSGTGSGGGSGSRAFQLQLLGCELRAAFPGYLSSTVMLRPDGNSSQLQVGSIYLKRIGNVEGTTISITTMTAPKDARSAYEKAQKNMAAQKLDSAEKGLNKAVEIYPHFAAAWELLGEVHEQKDQLEEAKSAYARALDADSKFVKPYFNLASIAAKGKNWQDTVRFSSELEKLNPYAYPFGFFLNAIGNYFLGNFDVAEKSARKFADLDTGHHRPDVALLLGDILEGKHDYAGAAEQLRTYLAGAPNDPRAESIKANAKRLEDLSAPKPQ